MIEWENERDAAKAEKKTTQVGKAKAAKAGGCNSQNSFDLADTEEEEDIEGELDSEDDFDVD